MPCYVFDEYDGGISNKTASVPCGPGSAIQSCCNTGDFCMTNNTCYSPETRYGAGVFQRTNLYAYNYYTAGCTDSKYTSPQCSIFCGHWLGLFKSCASTWTCGCPVANSCTCENYNSPDNYTFPPFTATASISGIIAVPLPVSSSLTPSVSGLVTTVLTTIVTSPTEHTIYLATPQPSTTNEAIHSHMILSTSAEAGIGVACFAGVVLILGLIFYFRRRIQNTNLPNDTAGYNGKAELDGVAVKSVARGDNLSEMQVEPRVGNEEERDVDYKIELDTPGIKIAVDPRVAPAISELEGNSKTFPQVLRPVV